MAKDNESIWTRTTHRTALDDASDLAYGPSGGPGQKWALGVGLATAIVGYGVYCVWSGHTILIGRGTALDVTGAAGFWLAVAYIAAGFFAHFHWHWGNSERLYGYSEMLKIVAAGVFVSAFLYALYRVLS